MIKKIKNLIDRAITTFIVNKMTPNNSGSEAISQLLLQMTYKSMAVSGTSLPPLSEVGFRLYSQTDEDGILLYIFSLLGTTNKRCVEIGASNGIECNTANLIINHGWTGLLIDGNSLQVKLGQEFYRRHKATHIYPPTFVCAWITRDNINSILKQNGFEGQIDLLSIDVDGVDYWLWDAIDAIAPRVVVVEYQDIIGPDKALTVPYRDDFNAYEYSTTHGMPNFCGASLLSLVKLAQRKGYRLVGCNRYGYNAFFIRADLGSKELPEIAISDCFKHPKVISGMKERFPQVKALPWVEV